MKANFADHASTSTEPTPTERTPAEVSIPESRWQRAGAAWDRGGSALIGAPGSDSSSASAHCTAATGELRNAVSGVGAATHDFTPDKPGIPSDDALAPRVAVQAAEHETPAAGTPRSEWTHMQVLLAAANRLADLADALENGLAGELSPAELAQALDIAHTILDAAERTL